MVGRTFDTKEVGLAKFIVITSALVFLVSATKLILSALHDQKRKKIWQRERRDIGPS